MHEYSRMDDGCLIITVWSGRSVIEIWDGRSHVDINLTIDELDNDYFIKKLQLLENFIKDCHYTLLRDDVQVTLDIARYEAYVNATLHMTRNMFVNEVEALVPDGA